MEECEPTQVTVASLQRHVFDLRAEITALRTANHAGQDDVKNAETVPRVKYPYAVAGTCRPGFQIGKFTLYDGMAGSHKVWIEDCEGGGGDFDSTELEAVISQFYDERHFDRMQRGY